MAFDIPTLPELKQRIEADILSRVIPGTGILRRSFIKILSIVYANVIFLTYGFLQNYALNFFPTKAIGLWLDEHASVWLNNGRNGATAASGDITPTGAVGINIPAGTIFIGPKSAEYKTDILLVLPGSVTVTAQTTGTDGNALENDIMTIQTPIVGVNEQALVAAGGLTGGAGNETDQRLRERVLNRIQYIPAGGTEQDYINWVLDGFANATRVWVRTEGGPGTVWIYFVEDAEIIIIPIAAHVATVQTLLDGKRPVGSTVTAFASVGNFIKLTMNLSPNTAAVQSAVTASMLSFQTNTVNQGETILRSQIDEAISLADGETDHTITKIEVAAVSGGPYTEIPVDDIGLAFNEIGIFDPSSFN